MKQTNKRRMEITIETHSVTIIRTRGGKATNIAYCRNCGTNAAVFRSAHAALIFHVCLAELERLSRVNLIHRAENGDLCASSLAAFFGQEIRCVED